VVVSSPDLAAALRTELERLAADVPEDQDAQEVAERTRDILQTLNGSGRATSG
jgi:hypothetical protein